MAAIGRGGSAPNADPSRTIGAPYVGRPDELSVQTCLNAFVATELLSGANKVTCEACTKRAHMRQRQQATASPPDNDDTTSATKKPTNVLTNATKQFLISSLPAVLILHLKRFQIGARHRIQKIQTDVAFPLVLDMAPYCAAAPQLRAGRFQHTVHEAQTKLLYALYGVVVHQGQIGGGHYVAYVKLRAPMRPDDRRWRFVRALKKRCESSCGGGGGGDAAAAAAATVEQQPRTLHPVNKRLEGVAQQDCCNDADNNNETNASFASSASSASSAHNYDSDDSLTGEQIRHKADAKRAREAAARALRAEQEQAQAPDGKWFYVSDTHVAEVSAERVLRAQAYLLFYERIF